MNQGAHTPRGGWAAGIRLLPALALLAVCALPGTLRADVLILESGARIEGEIVHETPAEVTLRTTFGGIVVVSRDRIRAIERDFDPHREMENRSRRIRDDDAESWYQLAVWCRDHGLGSDARDLLERVIRIDPNHQEARRDLGYIFHEGRWWTREEYNQDVLGLIYYQGRWVTPAERAMIERGFERNEQGEWVPATGADEGPAVPRLTGGTHTAPEPSTPTPPPITPRPQGGRLPPPPPPPPASGGAGEDTRWYDDHTAVPWSQAREFETDNYIITTNVREEYVRNYARMLELYHARFCRVFQNFLPRGGIPKSRVTIYANQQEFMSQTGMGPDVGGFYSTLGRTVTAYHGRFGDTGTTRTVIAHEGTHQFEDIIVPFDNCPIWLLEGFAVFFESAYYDGETVRIGTVPQDRLTALKRGIESGDYIPLTELIRCSQAEFTGYHYAHAWSLIYMMVYYNTDARLRRNNQEVFSGLFRLARERPVTPEDVEALFGGPERFAAFEETWKQWVLDLPYDFDPDATEQQPEDH